MTSTRVPRRVVRLAVDYDYGDYVGFQLNFMDQVNGRLLPATRVFIGDVLLFESNSLGCKGAELEPGRPVIGVFGDSVVQGSGLDSFPDHIRIDPFQVLNGGVEGSRLQRTVDRFLELQARVPMACALVHTGWHDLSLDGNTEDQWRAQLDRVQGPPVIGHFRLVADVHPDVIVRGYASKWRDGDYWPWRPEIVHSAEGLGNFRQCLDRFNAFIEGYCAERGRLLVDLAPVLAPKTFEDVSARFMDLIHPRVTAYEAIGQAIAEQIAAPLRPFAPADMAPRTPAGSPPQSAPAPPLKAAALPETGRNYPLW